MTHGTVRNLVITAETVGRAVHIIVIVSWTLHPTDSIFLILVMDVMITLFHTQTMVWQEEPSFLTLCTSVRILKLFAMMDPTVTIFKWTVAIVTLTTLSAFMVALLAVIELGATFIAGAHVVIEEVAMSAVQTL